MHRSTRTVRFHLLALAAAALGVSFGVAGCGGAKGATESQLAAGQNASATGGLLYDRHCAQCHGEQGAGNENTPAALGPGTIKSGKFATAQDLFNFLANEMPKDDPGRYLVRLRPGTGSFSRATIRSDPPTVV